MYVFIFVSVRQKDSQRVQREAALAQHSQLDAMLRRQAENRQQMQAIIAAHQERITQRIKVNGFYLTLADQQKTLFNGRVLNRCGNTPYN